MIDAGGEVDLFESEEEDEEEGRSTSSDGESAPIDDGDVVDIGTPNVSS